MGHYIALLRKEESSDYGVSFPDFPGCVTAGSSLEEAGKLAVEALEFHIQRMLEDGEEIPAPTTLDEIIEDPENVDGVALLVTVRSQRARAVRVNITIPSDMLEAIDKAADSEGTTRSAFLAEAAMDRVRQTE